MNRGEHLSRLRAFFVVFLGFPLGFFFDLIVLGNFLNAVRHSFGVRRDSLVDFWQSSSFDVLPWFRRKKYVKNYLTIWNCTEKITEKNILILIEKSYWEFWIRNEPTPERCMMEVVLSRLFSNFSTATRPMHPFESSWQRAHSCDIDDVVIDRAAIEIVQNRLFLIVLQPIKGKFSAIAKNGMWAEIPGLLEFFEWLILLTCCCCCSRQQQ